MKKRTLGLFGLALVCALFIGCPEPSIELYKVSFYDGTEFLKTVEVVKGSLVNDVYSLEDDNRHFAGWTLDGVAYNYEITKDCSFYANWQAIANVYDYDHTTLISTEYLDFNKDIESQNNETLSNLKNEIFMLEEETYGFYYFSDSVDSTENDYGTKYLTVIETSPVDIYPVAVSGNYPKYYKADASDSCIDVSWTYTEDSYTVVLKDSTDNVIYNNVHSKSANSNSDKVSFYRLNNDETYTIQLVGNKNTFELHATPKIVKVESDWVVAFYMDGDNNLNNFLWLDFNEIEQGLSEIRDSNNNPLPEYDSVSAVLLWDGYAELVGEDDNYGTKNSLLFEVGCDSSENISEKYMEYERNPVYLGNYTKNLSYTADWLTEKKEIGTDINEYYGEVNMGSKNNLVNYLNWVNAHYTAKKGVILQFSDHGGGPRSVQYAKMPNGLSVSMNNQERRALCWDEDSDDDFLKTGDVSEALKEAGYGTNNKLAMIIMDVCLGGSVEDSYEFSPYSKYLLASPNNIPAYGLNYIALMKSFTKGTNIEEIGKTAVIDYESFYEEYYEESMLEQIYFMMNMEGYEELQEMTEEQLMNYIYNLENVQGSLIGCTTMSLIDLSKVQTLAGKISSLSSFILDNANKKTLSVTLASGEKRIVSYSLYLASSCLDVLEAPNYDFVDLYEGSFTWLCDIGSFASGIVDFASTEGYEWPELVQKAQDVLDAMDNAVVSTWRDSLFFDNYYSKFDKRTGYDHPFGLTISSYMLAVNDERTEYVPGYAPYSFYPKDLQFGKDTTWFSLLFSIFGPFLK